jgi:hypothetical protein
MSRKPTSSPKRLSVEVPTIGRRFDTVTSKLMLLMAATHLPGIDFEEDLTRLLDGFAATIGEVQEELYWLRGRLPSEVERLAAPTDDHAEAVAKGAALVVRANDETH